MPTMAVWMPEITVQISPPLKFCGVCVSSVHISDNFPFQSASAFSRILTIQLSLMLNHLRRRGEIHSAPFPPCGENCAPFLCPSSPTQNRSAGFCVGPLWESCLMVRHDSPVEIGPLHSAPMVDRISLLNAMISPPNTHSIPWLRWLASWDWMLMPSWTMPQPRMITPMALMQEKINSLTL